MTSARTLLRLYNETSSKNRGSNSRPFGSITRIGLHSDDGRCDLQSRRERLKIDYSRLRGKFDVPKERWISYPHYDDRRCSPMDAAREAMKDTRGPKEESRVN